MDKKQYKSDEWLDRKKRWLVDIKIWMVGWIKNRWMVEWIEKMFEKNRWMVGWTGKNRTMVGWI